MSSFQWGNYLMPESDNVEHYEGDGSGSEDELTLPIVSTDLSEEDKIRIARLAAYQDLLLQMFGSNFECVPINGGFSGSSVVRIAPFDSIGNREESVIVKLDKGGNIRMEVAHSLQAHRALGDGAARILGDPIFVHKDDIEYGAFKMELAGACWHIPEFVGGSMINTFRDIAVFESEERVLDDEQQPDRPYGSVDRIIKELFGQDRGPTRSLRRYEETPEGGDRRISKSQQLTGAELLISRLPMSIFVCEEELALFFANQDVASTIQSVLVSVRSALSLMSSEWKIMRGFCHGDLNGANILIDSMDGMWLIDFANAYKLPLTSDLAKFETCFLFEYCIVPVPSRVVAQLCADQPAELLAQWFRVPESIIASIGESLEGVQSSEELLELIELHCGSDTKSNHRLRARIYFEELEDVSFNEILFTVSNYVCENLVPSCASSPHLIHHRYTESFFHGVSHVLRMREYFFEDIRKSVWAQTSELFNYDVSNVELCVLLIREVSRILKFRDVPPWIKFVALGYLKRLGAAVVGEISDLGPLRVISHDMAPTVLTHQVSALGVTEKIKYFKYIRACYGHITDFVSGKQLDVHTQCSEFRLRRVDNGELVQTWEGKYLLQGIGGSGKTCFLRRLAIDQILNDDGLVPIFVSCIFDNIYNWLETAFSDDVPRMRFLLSAIESGTALLLFDDINEASLSAIEALPVQVVATCKRLFPSSQMIALEICPMDRDQRNFVVHAREGTSVKFLNFFDSFVESQSSASSELVLSVGFLSLLLCYWQNVSSIPAVSATPPPSGLHRQVTEPPVSHSEASISDVYRVAVSVLVHRYLMAEEADRFLVRQSSKRLMSLLRLVAIRSKMTCTVGFTSHTVVNEFGVDVVLWHQIASHVLEGKFPLLSFGSSKYTFTMGGIQDYLSSEALSLDELCMSAIRLRDLVIDSEWSSVLSILAERAPRKYLSLAEADVPDHETVLHVSARAGCVSLFTLLGTNDRVDALIHVPNILTSMLPLHEAAKNGNTAICRLLIAAKASVWQPTNLGWCPLHFAASSHNREVCAMLLSARSDGGPSLPLLSRAGLDLGKAVLDQSISSTEFLDRVKLVFPELSYFRGRSDTTPDASASVKLEPSEIELKRTLCAMLAVYYICADRYDEFVQHQAIDNRLSRSSWERIRAWSVADVKLTTPEAVDAMLSLMAVHDLGKLKDFRNDLAPDYKDHDAAMKYIIETTPDVLPSLCRLHEEYQYLVRTTLGLEFNFGQFLQAENLPANLLPIKNQLLGSNGLAFYLFHIFVDMSGIMGAISLKGSLFMTETMYINFAQGIDSLSLLAKESVNTVYDHFLRTRALSQGLGEGFNRSIIRLACLSRIFDPSGADELIAAHGAVPPHVRSVLQDHLNRDGAGAFLIYYGPAFMENCKLGVGLETGLTFLAQIFEAAEAMVWDSQKVVVIHIAEAAELAKHRFDAYGIFFRIERSSGRRGQTEGTLRISPWSGGKSEIEFYDHDYLATEKIHHCVLATRLFTLLSSSDCSYMAFHKQVPGCMSRRPWEEFRSWVTECVTSVAAMHALLAIVDIGTVLRLRDDLKISSSLSSDEARNEILTNHLHVVPSFALLSLADQDLVKQTLMDLSAIQVSRIVVGENGLSRLSSDFFLVASMLLAPTVLLSEGGYHATRFLQRRGSEYYKYRLQLAGDNLGVFEPIVKLVCLCSIYSPSGGASLWQAWRNVSESVRIRIQELLVSNQRLDCAVGLSESLTNIPRGGLEDALISVVTRFCSSTV